jgi:uncharacterized membrane protein
VVGHAPARRVQRLEVTVKGGYRPDVIRVRRGAPVELTFDRQESGECTSRVVFGDLQVSVALPAYEKTTVRLDAARVGSFGFARGMNMIHSTPSKANSHPCSGLRRAIGLLTQAAGTLANGIYPLTEPVSMHGDGYDSTGRTHLIIPRRASPEETGMYWYGDHMNGWGYGLMTVSMLLFWALLIVGVVALVRYLGRTGPANPVLPPRPIPEDLLAERFARGEINTDEYRERLETLRSGTAPTSSSSET